MTLADDLAAPPLARRVAEIIRSHASALELGPDWADAAALRVLVEVGRRPATPFNAIQGVTEDGDLVRRFGESWLAPEIWDAAQQVREDIRADFLNDEGRSPWER